VVVVVVPLQVKEDLVVVEVEVAHMVVEVEVGIQEDLDHNTQGQVLLEHTVVMVGVVVLLTMVQVK